MRGQGGGALSAGAHTACQVGRQPVGGVKGPHLPQLHLRHGIQLPVYLQTRSGEHRNESQVQGQKITDANLDHVIRLSRLLPIG